MLGVASDGVLARVRPLLKRPELLDAVDDPDEYVALTEQFEAALVAADGAAYLAASSDFSARTSYLPGEQPTAPNLAQARQYTETARDTLQAIVKLLGTAPRG